ncbi:hypothetical protein [Bacillus sp. NEB1478]|uniref:hypothetical protein n=1 Tax=Bacillus sp. NEB1478 TaxID=3073816 RepID=UPI0028738DFA|nr:hypothetical protein [Bacillus sp. NEB1478]WNB93420.1 hypothetical protein RGB74_07050 [Bacillus sp. NEB1478]
MAVSLEKKKEKIDIEVKNGAVTFLDVLGWKGIWEKQKDAINLLHGLVYLIKELATEITFKISSENPEARGINTTVLSISDTIAIFTPGIARYALQIHAEICERAIPESIKRAIPLRGATSYGEFSFKENIMVGAAVDESASWHESTDWIGVILTPSPIFHLGNEYPETWIKYDHIPFKRSVRGMDRCVKWEFNEKELYKLFTDMGPFIPEIAPKYTNTIKFLENTQNLKP